MDQTVNKTGTQTGDQKLNPLVAYLTSQFARPRGPLGVMAGRIMSQRGSNVDRNFWMLDLLGFQPDDRVLEIGPGPGVALAAVAERVTLGELVAIDHSPIMLRQTAKRTAEAVAQGRVTLIEGDAGLLPANLGRFDRIYAMNVWQFWDDQEAVIDSLTQRLNVGGKLALGYQPRHRGATAADADAGRRCLVDQFAAGGLSDVADHMLDLEPPVTCVIGARSAG
ncbi:MAG: class I SAM-dependent methyltransferase [Acidimicrobiales bacterium]